MKLTRTSLLSGMVALAATAFAPAAANAASTATVTGTVSGSNLSLSTSAAPTFADNLDNGDATPTYPLPMTIQDTRGTGAGWNATITSTQFTTGGSTPSTLATTASSISAVASTCASGTCTNPTNSVTYAPLAVPAGSGATPVKFFNAATSTGMGKFTVTPTIGVFVPQSTTAGSYTSTVTLAIITGP